LRVKRCFPEDGDCTREAAIEKALSVGAKSHLGEINSGLPSWGRVTIDNNDALYIPKS
jgi:hypothetical protein